MANLITNGSFEGIVVPETNAPNNAVAPGWYVVSGSPDINRSIIFGGPGGPASDGDNWALAFADGTSSGNEVLGQILATPLSAGQSYTFTIDLEAGGLYDTTFVLLDQDNNILGTALVPKTSAQGVWNAYDITFTSASPITEIRLQPGNSAGGVLAMDNVRLDVACFARGTLIKTKVGEIAVEDLSQGDMVLTMDNGYQSIRWVGSQEVSAARLDAHKNLVPIRIRAGALGCNMPEQDLLVSPQHRILVRSRITERMSLEGGEILVPAKHLVLIDGIDIAYDVKSVEYFHFMFDRHELVASNGAFTESLYTGPEALKSVSEDARAEILGLFPELADIDYQATSARQLANGRMGRKLAIRHKNNSKALVEMPRN